MFLKLLMVQANVHFGSDITVSQFRDIIEQCCTCDGMGCDGCCIIVSYSRAIMNQTGTGHFSPIGGYHRERDMVLIMDVARFKYPPHWVPLELLHTAMCSIDEDSGKSRGCLVLSPSQQLRDTWCSSHDPTRVHRANSAVASATPCMASIAEDEVLGEGSDNVSLPPPPVADEECEGGAELGRARSNTGAAMAALWGISDSSPAELAKDNPIVSLIKHRCACCK
jgi:hypothetical protein